MNGQHTDNSVHDSMLSALELFYYANKFRGSLFIVFLRSDQLFRDTLIDLRLLTLAGIRVVVFAPATERVVSLARLWSAGEMNIAVKRDVPWEGEGEPGRLVSGSGCVSRYGVTAILYTMPNEQESLRAYKTEVFRWAQQVRARKVFLMRESGGLFYKGRLLSHPTSDELAEIERELSAEEREDVQFLRTRAAEFSGDTVVLPARAGALYEETFSHGGVGTLISADYPNELRVATEQDVSAICSIMRPYAERGFVLPFRAQEVLDEIKSYYVYTVNGEIVALSKLREYRDAYEIGKLCTLPRYQGRGRARSLVEFLKDEVVSRGKQYAFSLTVSDKTAQFFLSLGFKEVSRDTLPKEWQDSYDFSRDSRAFVYSGPH